MLIVGRRDGVVYRKAYGNRSLRPTTQPMTDDTVFDLASITKAVATTTMAAVLWERGQIKLEQKVRTFFREFHDGGKQDVTIAMLLSHSSGLPAYEKLFQRCSGAGLVPAGLQAARITSGLVNAPAVRRSSIHGREMMLRSEIGARSFAPCVQL